MKERYVRIEISRTQLKWALCLLFICAGAHDLASESLTLSTTYPAPFGVYNQIITTGNAGPAPADTTLNKTGGNTILVPASNGAGSVGIGTTRPRAKLDLQGSLRFADGSQGAGRLLTSDEDGVASWQAVIVCDAVRHADDGGGGVYGFTFKASECGGKLPDEGYYGMINMANACGGALNVAAINAGETDGGTAGPGVDFLSDGGVCGAGDNLHFRVVYIKIR